VLEHANVTGNAAECVAGLAFNSCYRVQFQYCEILSNSGSNLVVIWTLPSTLIRCSPVRLNATEDGYTTRQALFFVNGPVAISERAIAVNSVTVFVRGEMSSSAIAFSECHFDSFSQARPTSRVAPAFV
jgi:hypothetical protein